MFGQRTLNPGLSLTKVVRRVHQLIEFSARELGSHLWLITEHRT